jgi:hypothetical protein
MGRVSVAQIKSDGSASSINLIDSTARAGGMGVYWGYVVMRFILVAILLAFLLPSAGKAAVYHWEGTCTLGCTGTASADLTLASGSPLSFDLNYFPTHDVSDFISFQYTSSSGSFYLNNTSPYLYAQGVNGGLLLEENGQGPNMLPLWQFSFNLAANAGLTLSPELGAWQFLSGSYFWTCLDALCTTWTDNVIRDVGVNGSFAVVQASVPEPST